MPFHCSGAPDWNYSAASIFAVLTSNKFGKCIELFVLNFSSNAFNDVYGTWLPMQLIKCKSKLRSKVVIKFAWKYLIK